MRGGWVSVAGVLALVGSSLCVVPTPCPNTATTCTWSQQFSQLTFDQGPVKFALGGLFDVRDKGGDAFTCTGSFNPYQLMLSHAFLWSVKYWRERAPASTVGVGAVVFDSCGRHEQMIQNILGFEQCTIKIPDLDRNQLVGFVGPTSNAATMAAASLTSEMDLTLISPTADAVALSDHAKYKYFLRTSASIAVEVDVMVAALKIFNTKFAAAIYLQSEADTFKLFESKVKAQACLVASYPMTGSEADGTIATFVNTQLRALQKTRFIALFMSPEFAQRFIAQVQANTEVKSMNFVFLTPSEIKRSSAFYSDQNAVAAADAIMIERKLPSTVSVAEAMFTNYWTNLTSQKVLDPNNVIKDPFLGKYLADGNRLPAYDMAAGFVMMATKAMIDGVRTAGQQLCANSQSYLCSSFFSSAARGSQVNQQVRTSSGLFSLLANGSYQNGDLRPSQVAYNIYRKLEGGGFQKFGEYSNNQLTGFSLTDLSKHQPGECPVSPCLPCGELPTTTPAPSTPAPTTVVPVCKPPFGGNFSVVYYPPDQEITGAYMKSVRADSDYATRFEIGRKWIIALGVLAGLGILAVFVFEIYILYKMLGTQMGQKWRTMWLGQLLLFGIFLCYLTLFAYLPIPTKATCGLTRFGVGVSYSVCFGVLLVKLMVILTSKSSENSLIPGDVESPNYLKGIYQFLMFVFVVGVQVVIDAQWLITVPPEAVRVVTNSGKEAWICNHYTFQASGNIGAMSNMAEFVRNEFENHLLSLVYIMFLILITTLLALNAHGIITNHRESVFIGIASGFSIPLWLAWGLVGGLNRDHEYAHEFGDACIAFGLFLTATLILFSMFLPKVRQLVNMGVEGIYYEDDRDTYYAGSVIMAPPSYKQQPSRPNSVIYVNNQGIYSEPVVVGNGDTSSNYLRHPGGRADSTYSAPAAYLKKGGDGTVRGGGSVLRVTDDLSGRRPLEKKRPMSEVAYGTTASRPRSMKGTLPRSRSQTNLGAL